MTTAAATPVLSLTYTSSATRLLSIEQLVELVEEIRPKNARLGITGLLLYSGGNVIQTLEGAPHAVDSVFGSIMLDPRHTDVRVVERRDAQARSFAAWSMGFRNITAREAADISGYTEFVRHSVGRDLATHRESAFELLERFRASAV